MDSGLAFQNVSIGERVTYPPVYKLCSRSLGCVSAWTLFTAATVTDRNVRDKLIQQAWSIAFNNVTIAFGIGDQYSNTTEGIQVVGDPGYVVS